MVATLHFLISWFSKILKLFLHFKFFLLCFTCLEERRGCVGGYSGAPLSKIDICDICDIQGHLWASIYNIFVIFRGTYVQNWYIEDICGDSGAPMIKTNIQKIFVLLMLILVLWWCWCFLLILMLMLKFPQKGVLASRWVGGWWVIFMLLMLILVLW